MRIKIFQNQGKSEVIEDAKTITKESYGVTITKEDGTEIFLSYSGFTHYLLKSE